MPVTKGHRAVFLDRDGTINVEKKYLHRIEDFEFIPGVPEAIRLLRAAGFVVIVITNQSGVARGYYDLRDVDRLHEHIQEQLDLYGTAIDGFYVCPHHATEGIGAYRVDCECRKGAPGMLLEAAVNHGVDLSRSFMIGDKLADIEAGHAAGCLSFLVRTGYGAEHEKTVLARFPGVCVFDDLVSAAQHIARQESIPN